ncbi:MAG TPA: 50S ribosomal protein L35 [Syntrophales bacterium]|nr:50S ribosomal protein L35 [Syntrophales bacterium]HOX94978.1 50S ribosomal protein L35 [Syntrophales bacterium]HPI58382.1 50S ribosomal protein L35 [Syntrophales bacterium]HPN26056.1 50S ribosomal protein L35 [Syntrophales bacterium]HQM30393.1 50S ribosomal protein L35 [Syntrophales bacterium]
MPKIKTHRGAAKRFSLTAGGKVKRSKAFARHILTKKTAKRKRNMRQGVVLKKVDETGVKKLIPYL